MNIEPGQTVTAPPATDDPASPADLPPAGWRLWWLAIRPRTLTMAVAPVLAGTALGWAEGGHFDPRPFLAALGGALMIQAGANLYNDVGDALRGGDQPLRQGPPRVTALGWATPARVRAAAIACFGLACLFGLYLIALGGVPILLLGLASLAGGWCYSGGARPISYGPYGELCVIAFFGIGAVAGSAYLQTGTLLGSAVLVGLALGAVAAAVLMANNYRDMEPDRLVGRRTLAIQLGPRHSRFLYAAMVLAPFALLAGPTGPAGGWVTLAALPLAIGLIHRFFTEPRGPAFNRILGLTARLQLVMAALLSLGVVF
ncbi:1,4-dihydroxy-2-naphthoate octaprenyltransferase [Phaeospirillum tilakii]|uniref:1,4-dihydroxy-2-naphthoate octaprenyltransferase n=1 Tax=Phaeospirillum tilakii TaxID=741673 RepID=A0ABW5CA08_9PROT